VPVLGRGVAPGDGRLHLRINAKATKNRMHLDLRVPDMEAETARVVALGARRVTDVPLEEFGWSWQVFADPDDNEFCVLQPPKDDGSD
jgi:predicted enzyme related to lactoylglutathione lyase